MEDLRRAAREHLKRPDLDANPEFDPEEVPIPGEIDLLWKDISSKRPSSHLELCESLLVAKGYLRTRGSRSLLENDENAANHLYGWASIVALPSSDFAETEGWSQEKKRIASEAQFRLTLAVSVLAYLSAQLPIQKAINEPDIVLALASFSNERDPWTTGESFSKSTTVLGNYVTEKRIQSNRSFWAVVEYILRDRIKPLFTKARNPSITAAGRKSFNPIPLPRFDASVLDPETKPWKIRDVYATTVFSWALSLYLPTNQNYLEEHLSLLIPPLLALIDDESLPFKTRGCDLLSRFLTPIRENKSDILRRTNLSSVFEDALAPCLHSLPTIASEEESLRLLGAAYPALLSLLKTTYRNHSVPSEPMKPRLSNSDPRNQQLSKDNQKFIDSITKILRTNLITSFHHISSTNPISVSSFASFPYPRLSTFFINQITITIYELQIHTTKYLQELVPLIYSTLSNPFGTAYPALLLAATTFARAVVLNAHPRLWRWCGELLGGLCSCWLHVLEETKRIGEQASDRSKSDANEEMVKLGMQLKGVVYLLKFALQNPVPVQGEIDAGQLDAKEKLGKELQELVDADNDLEDLLFAEINPDDADGFF